MIITNKLCCKPQQRARPWSKVILSALSVRVFANCLNAAVVPSMYIYMTSTFCEGFLPTTLSSTHFGRKLSPTKQKLNVPQCRSIEDCGRKTDKHRMQLTQSTGENAGETTQLNRVIINTENNTPRNEQKPSLIKDSVFQQDVASTLLIALIVGALTGIGVSIFKLSIDEVRKFSYSLDLVQFHSSAFQAAFIPAIGGLVVSLLGLAGEFSPGLRGQVAELDAEFLSKRRDVKNPFRYLRKTLAAVATLGTGCSLGPEGPSVEVGMSTTRVLLNSSILKEKFNLSRKQGRLLLSCGAAAGVSAGFDAPISAVFFVLEIVQAAFIAEQKASNSATNQNDDALSSSNDDGIDSVSSRESIQSVLLASVMSAGVSRQILQDHLTLKLNAYSLTNPFLELPLYLLLGALCGITAFAFSQFAKIAKDAFEGSGPIGQIPPFYRPIVGGLVSGVVGLAFPQILFFGYETLNSLLANRSLPTSTMLELLVVKAFTTAVAAGSGLVGGTFAPSLFLGGMLGASFHNIVEGVLHTVNVAMDSSMFTIADVPAYAMVGGASVLAALFRAPLTGSLLVFELSHDYNVILPLMASAGAGSLVADVVETAFQAREKRKSLNSVAWGDLATEVEIKEENGTK